jgi:A/G-specific adenine glycosylase
VCLPNGSPRCAECPVRTRCEAAERGLTGEIPVKSRPAPRRIEERTIFLLRREGRFALRRRAPRGLLAGLWEFPSLPGKLSGPEAHDALKKLGIETGELSQLPASKHVFTHLEWRMTAFRAEADGSRVGPDGWIWATLEEIRDIYSLPTAFKAYLRILD